MINKKLCFCVCLFLVQAVERLQAQTPAVIYTNRFDYIKNIRFLEMIVKEGAGSFDNILAMNINYQPIKKLREDLEKTLDLKLDFLRAWNKLGEAHITVITPVEYANVLKPFISMDEIKDIAQSNFIQYSEILPLGIGSGKKEINGKIEETFFMIMESPNLRKIRQKIYALFIEKGGNPNSWNPQHYFPHVTIGFTKRDLHENDGILKNMEYSSDPRFELIYMNSMNYEFK